MVKRVLFVDDDKFLADIASQILLGKYEIFIFQKSMEALEVFKSDPDKFDIIITDFCMPGMDGLDLAKEIKAINPTIPIILCSGFIDTASPEEINSIGFAEVFTKPYSIKDLAKAVEKVLNQTDAQV